MKDGYFVAPHGIWVDDEGSIYMAEVTNTMGVSLGYVRRKPIPSRNLRGSNTS